MGQIITKLDTGSPSWYLAHRWQPAIAKGRYCHVMYKLLYPSIRIRTAPPVSVRVRTTVSVSVSLRILFCNLHVRTFAIADLNPPINEYYVQSSKVKIAESQSAKRWSSGRSECRACSIIVPVYFQPKISLNSKSETGTVTVPHR